MIKSALRRFKCLGSLNSAENVGKKVVGTFGKFTRELSGCLLVLEATYKELGKNLCLREKTHTHIHISFYHLQSAIRGAQRRR